MVRGYAPSEQLYERRWKLVRFSCMRLFSGRNKQEDIVLT